MRSAHGPVVPYPEIVHGISRGWRSVSADAEAQAVGGSRRQILYEHVGAGEDLVQDVPAARVLEVQGEGFLGAVEPDEIAGVAVHARVVAAREVALAGPLHLDHPGAEIGELPGGVRSGNGLFQADHRDAGQGS